MFMICDRCGTPHYGLSRQEAFSAIQHSLMLHTDEERIITATAYNACDPLDLFSVCSNCAAHYTLFRPLCGDDGIEIFSPIKIILRPSEPQMAIMSWPTF